VSRLRGAGVLEQGATDVVKGGAVVLSATQDDGPSVAEMT
jgi:hypothetical protein